MSSTNRSAARDAHKADYYVTPVNSIMDFLMEFDNDWPELSFTGGDIDILDPCAGGDAVSLMSYPTALLKFDPVKYVHTVDIRPDSRALIKADYLTLDCKDKVDVIITNPPFNLALPIIQKALNDVRPGGLVVMLLRLNFFGSQERSAWFEKHMPLCCYVHSRRMKFTEKGTDSIEYMHAVWQKDKYPKFTSLRII